MLVGAGLLGAVCLCQALKGPQAWAQQLASGNCELSCTLTRETVNEACVQQLATADVT